MLYLDTDTLTVSVVVQDAIGGGVNAMRSFSELEAGFDKRQDRRGQPNRGDGDPWCYKHRTLTDRQED